MKQPNIVYILADDMGYGDVSCLNERSALHTPHIDAMHDAGLSCTNAHASSAVCTPSRYSIMTGRYCWRTRLKNGVLFGYDEPLIDRDRETVASYLKGKGYKTACIGKWHLGFEWSLKDEEDKQSIDYEKPLKDTPVHHGFDYFYGIAGSLDMPPYVYVENDRVTAVPDRICGDESGVDGLNKGYFRTGPTGSDFVHEEVLGNFTQRVLDTLDQYKDDPFFIYFPLTAPHTPILPTEKYRGRSGTNAYGDFVLMCDDIVGMVNQKLEKLGLLEDTIVVFTSDNGCSPMANFPELAQYGHNPSYIFRGHKADIYEGGHRIPYIIQWPKGIKAGSQSDATVCLSDMYATLRELHGDEPDSGLSEDSVSNLPLWQGDTQKEVRESIIHHSINGSFSIRKGRWKLVACPDSGGWSLPRPGTVPEDEPKFQLYDMATDIRERRNLYGTMPEVEADLMSLLQWHKDNNV